MNKLVLLILSFVFIACNDAKLNQNEQAPEIFATTTKGEKVKLMRSGIEIVEFWQNGCSACLKVMNELDSYAKEHGIRIYAINSIDDIKLIKQHEIDNDYSSMVFLQDKQDISWSRYEIFAVPTLFILKDGVYIDRVLGDRGFKYIKSKLEAVL